MEIVGASARYLELRDCSCARQLVYISSFKYPQVGVITDANAPEVLSDLMRDNHKDGLEHFPIYIRLKEGHGELACALYYADLTGRHWVKTHDLYAYTSAAQLLWMLQEPLIQGFPVMRRLHFALHEKWPVLFSRPEVTTPRDDSVHSEFKVMSREEFIQDRSKVCNDPRRDATLLTLLTHTIKFNLRWEDAVALAMTCRDHVLLGVPWITQRGLSVIEPWNLTLAKISEPIHELWEDSCRHMESVYHMALRQGATAEQISAFLPRDVAVSVVVTATETEWHRLYCLRYLADTQSGLNHVLDMCENILVSYSDHRLFDDSEEDEVSCQLSGEK